MSQPILAKSQIELLPSEMRVLPKLIPLTELLKSKDLTLSLNQIDLILKSKNQDALIEKITATIQKLDNPNELLSSYLPISLFDLYLFLLLEVLDQGVQLNTSGINKTLLGMDKGLFKFFSPSEKETIFKQWDINSIENGHLRKLLRPENGDDVKVFIISVNFIHYYYKITEVLNEWDKKDLKQLFNSIGLENILDPKYDNVFGIFMNLIEFSLDEHFECLKSNAEKLTPQHGFLISKGINKCSKDQAIFLIKKFSGQDLLKKLHPFLERHQISLLNITNEWIVNPPDDLRNRIVTIANSLIGKMQWTSTNRTYCNGLAPNDFALKYLKGDIPPDIKKTVQKKWDSLFTPDEPAHRLHMCCWQFCYVVYLLANHISEEMVSTLLQSDTQSEDILTAALHGNKISLYETTLYKTIHTDHPQKGDLILYKSIVKSRPHHAAIYIGDNKVIHLVNSQVEIASLLLDSPLEIHHIPVTLIPINIHNYIKAHPNPSFKPATAAEVTYQLRNTCYSNESSQPT